MSTVTSFSFHRREDWMDSYNPLHSHKHGIKIISLLFIFITASEALYNIGVGIADVTGPAAEIVFVS